MGSRRLSNKDPQPDRFRIQQSSSSQGRQSWRPSRTSFDSAGGQMSTRSTLSRASRTPMKASTLGGNATSSRSTYSGRTSRTPLRQSRPSNRSTFGRPRLSSLSKGGDTQSKDPRELKSKIFQSSAISCLIDFLERKGFNQPLSRKILSSPSTREFKTIFEFMVIQLLPRYSIGASGLKLEQEVHNVFRDLGYNYMLNKQHLATVGAPHSWPYALAALDWLREVLEMEDAIENGENGADLCDENSFATSPDIGEIRQIFLRHEAGTYQEYLHNGVLPSYDGVVDELDKVMLDGFTENDLQDLRQERDMLRKALEERQSQDDPSREVQVELDEVMAAEHDLLEQLITIETEMESNVADIVAACEMRESAIQRKVFVETEIIRVNEAVSKQPMRREDVEQLLMRRKNLQAELDHQERVNIDLFDSIGLQERQVAGRMASIEPKTITLCHKANELGILENNPSLHISVGQLREPDTFVPQVQSILSSVDEDLKADTESAKVRLTQEMKRSQQVLDAHRQSTLLKRSNRERVEILDEEIRRVRERVHAQEEAMVEERLSWDRNQLGVREAVAQQEKEMRDASERVRRAEETLRIRDAELASMVAARETECREMNRNIRQVLKLSSEFGEYMQNIAKSIRDRRV